MWCFGNFRPSTICITVCLFLLVVNLCIVYYYQKLVKPVGIKLEPNLSYEKNVSYDYFHVYLNSTSNSAVCQSEDNLIIYILSTVTNFQRRKTIRSTWASPLMNTCFVFIVGQIQNSSSIQLLLNNEKEQYKDIVQINHVESYQNVVYKEVAALQWSSHFYPFIPYLFKTDDDLVIDSILISQIVQILIRNSSNDTLYISRFRPALVTTLLLSDRTTFFRGGWPWSGATVLRTGKFAVSQSVWPHSAFPSYCSGFGWFMSNNTRNRLLNASFTYPADKTVWIGDVFLSGFIAQAANLKCTGIPIDYEEIKSGYCPCSFQKRSMLTICSTTFHGGGRDDETGRFNEYTRAWNVIQQRHNLINRTNTTINEC